jgi:hypothetical protein
MGGIQTKGRLDELVKNIDKINLITKNELFIKKTGLSLTFQCDSDLSFLQRLFNDSPINVDVNAKINYFR